MRITSSVFVNNEAIPALYTCDGQNINPPLSIASVPSEAKSLVLIVDDPDAPVGTWVHWTLWNIAPQTNTIQENSVPTKATEGITSFGRSGYGGPCPPTGTHRYFFKLYALNDMLTIPNTTDASELAKIIEPLTLATATLVGTYRRNT